MAKSGSSPTGDRIIEVLKDGQLHSIDALRVCLADGELSENNAVHQRVFLLRKMLNPMGRDIVSQSVNGCTHYRMVRFLNGEDEK